MPPTYAKQTGKRGLYGAALGSVKLKPLLDSCHYSKTILLDPDRFHSYCNIQELLKVKGTDARIQLKFMKIKFHT